MLRKIKYSATLIAISSFSACPSGEFACDNGQCADCGVRCNNKNGGCSDGSDETNCQSKNNISVESLRIELNIICPLENKNKGTLVYKCR